MLCGEREMREKGEVKRECPASDRSHSIVCKKYPVFRMKAVNECGVKA
jgi:hypothetical protein